jgi:hypothetical protein
MGLKADVLMIDGLRERKRVERKHHMLIAGWLCIFAYPCYVD